MRTTTTCQSQRCPNMEFSIGVEVSFHLKIGNFFFFPFFLWFWPPRAHITQKSQIYRLILHIKSEKYRSDLALTLSLYLYGGLFLILHIKYWSTYLYGRNLCLTAPYLIHVSEKSKHILTSIIYCRGLIGVPKVKNES